MGSCRASLASLIDEVNTQILSFFCSGGAHLIARGSRRSHLSIFCYRKFPVWVDFGVGRSNPLDSVTVDDGSGTSFWWFECLKLQVILHLLAKI